MGQLLSHLLQMLLPNLLRQALQNPGMHQGFEGVDPLSGIPHQALLYQVHKLRVIAAHHVRQVYRTSFSLFSLFLRDLACELLVEELLPSLRMFQQLMRRVLEHFAE